MSKTAKAEQELLYTMLLLYFKNIAIHVFKWKNLPNEDINGLNSLTIEKYLFSEGKGLFFYTNETGYAFLPVAPTDNMNIYGIQQRYTATGTNFNKNFDVDNAVIVRNNALEIPTFFMVSHWCKKLANIDKATDINVNAIKTPFVFTGDEKSLNTMKNMYQQITDNEPVIYVNKLRSEDEITLNAILTGVDYQADKLQDLYTTYEHKILTYLGIDNSNIDKAERVQSAEVNAEEEFINANFTAQYESRKEACKAINAMFGLNIDVEINPEIIKTANKENEQAPKEQTEGVEK